MRFQRERGEDVAKYTQLHRTSRRTLTLERAAFRTTFYSYYTTRICLP